MRTDVIGGQPDFHRVRESAQGEQQGCGGIDSHWRGSLAHLHLLSIRELLRNSGVLVNQANVLAGNFKGSDFLPEIFLAASGAFLQENRRPACKNP